MRDTQAALIVCVIDEAVVGYANGFLVPTKRRSCTRPESLPTTGGKALVEALTGALKEKGARTVYALVEEETLL